MSIVPKRNSTLSPAGRASFNVTFIIYHFVHHGALPLCPFFIFSFSRTRHATASPAVLYFVQGLETFGACIGVHEREERGASTRVAGVFSPH